MYVQLLQKKGNCDIILTEELNDPDHSYGIICDLIFFLYIVLYKFGIDYWRGSCDTAIRHSGETHNA